MLGLFHSFCWRRGGRLQKYRQRIRAVQDRYIRKSYLAQSSSPKATPNCSPHDANLQQISSHICISPVARGGAALRARAKADYGPLDWP